MPTMIRKTKPPEDEVDKAVAAVCRAIARLIKLLGHEDLAVVHKAHRALAELGGAAIVGPLASALPRAPMPRHRGFIVMLLVEFAHQDKAQVGRALTAALRREEDPVLSAMIRQALSRTIIAHLVDVDGERQCESVARP